MQQQKLTLMAQESTSVWLGLQEHVALTKKGLMVGLQPLLKKQQRPCKKIADASTNRVNSPSAKELAHITQDWFKQTVFGTPKAVPR